MVHDIWDPHGCKEMIVNQIETYHILAQTQIESLMENNIEPAFEDFTRTLESTLEEEAVSEEEKLKWKEVKRNVVDYHIKALDLARQIRQN